MNRTQQLKLLNDEIRHLFDKDVDEKSAFDKLSTDQRFDSICRTSIQSLYKKLQKDHDTKQLDEKCKKKELNEKCKKKQLNGECKQVIHYQQNAKDLLLYEGLSVNEDQCVVDIWQNRYLVNAKKERETNGTHEINVHDLLQNISKKIYFSANSILCGIYYLSDNFILFDEADISSDFLRLARVDLIDSSLQFIQKIDCYDYSYLLIDLSNPSKFLLICENEVNSVVVCKLVGERIEVESKFLLENVDSLGDANAYFNDQLLMFKINVWTQSLSNTTITIQDLNAEKNSKTLKLSPLPSNVCNYSKIQTWSGDHLFLSVQFCLTSEYGVAFTNPQTCNWTVLEFAIKLPIGKFLLVNNHDLLVCAEERCPESKDYLLNVYKLPMRKPESLRSKAWIKTVELFKNKQVTDPYEEARQYLPLNSDIRGPFAADQIDDE